MAQLKDTLIAGDLRVTGTIYGINNNAADPDHTHGVITNSGYVGTTSNQALYTGTSGVITSGTLPIAAGGTGATSATAAWTALGGGASGKHADSYFALASHTHGNIQNGGTLQTNDVTIATGDKLVITDSSDSYKVARASISFNTSSTTSFLRNDGTWATPINTTYTLTTTGTGNAITAIGLSGTTITATKGSTFAVSTHTHDYAASSHSHGNITNAGAITTTVAIATGDKFVITDSSDSSKLKASSISFGTTTSSFLSNDGTWKQPAKYGTSLPSSGDFVGQIFVLTE